MSDQRPVNRPLEVWSGKSDSEIIFQVLQKLEPTESNKHAMWIVAAYSPDDGLLPREEAYAETIEENCVLVWREGQGRPLPRVYTFET